MPGTCSYASSIASLPESQRTKILNELTEDEALDLLYDWQFWARPDQLPPKAAWQVWLILAGRGWGKTRTGAEAVIEAVKNGAKRIALVGATSADTRDVMVEGESGIIACSRPDFMPEYEPSKRRLTWPNGAIATTYSGEEPNRLRGPQHDFAWADEPAAWKYPETWDMLMFGLRLGEDPRCVATTTPRPTKLIREIKDGDGTVLTRGTTYDNKANLAPTFFSKIITKYEGTRLGRQELNGEILEDNPGALWKRAVIDNLRVKEAPVLIRIVVGVDPAVTSNPDSDETGIVVAGKAADGHCYVLGDYSVQGTPLEWATASIRAYQTHKADKIIGEANNGGDLVEVNIRTVDTFAAYGKVHASRGKHTRAEPISSLYEQGKVHHVGSFVQLEDQMCEWAPDTGEKSPDRMDALVWALTELTQEPDIMIGGTARRSRRHT